MAGCREMEEFVKLWLSGVLGDKSDALSMFDMLDTENWRDLSDLRLDDD
jgi:hypothetical protein